MCRESSHGVAPEAGVGRHPRPNRQENGRMAYFQSQAPLMMQDEISATVFGPTISCSNPYNRANANRHPELRSARIRDFLWWVMSEPPTSRTRIYSHHACTKCRKQVRVPSKGVPVPVVRETRRISVYVHTVSSSNWNQCGPSRK